MVQNELIDWLTLALRTVTPCTHICRPTGACLDLMVVARIETKGSNMATCSGVEGAILSLFRLTCKS